MAPSDITSSQAREEHGTASLYKSTATTPSIQPKRESTPCLKSIEDPLHEDDVAIAQIFPRLCDTITFGSVETLEQCTEVAVHVINDIIQQLGPVASNRYAASELQSLHELVKSAKKPEFTLGVVGSTGTGKSCLINALLGETQLVPTNCVRACTAVITELSWNPSENPKERYIANVEFISPEEWRYELDKLFHDLTPPDDELAENAKSKSTDAEVALAKI